MQYGISRRLTVSFDEAIESVTDQLAREGFGILTEIDVKATLKKKLDVDFRKYRILGACNPPCAHRALSVEPNIGLMLPCNVVVQELESGEIEISAIDPAAAMQSIGNPDLEPVAAEVRDRLVRVIESLQP